MRPIRLFVPLVLSVLAACGDDGGGDSKSDAGRDMDSAVVDAAAPGEGGTDGAAPRPRLDPSLIPATFKTYDKASCGELGESCTLFSGSNCEGSICNLDPEVCLPQPKAGASLFGCSPGTCDEAAPYCIAGICLTYDQVSCVCGAAGGSKLAACAAPAVSALGAIKQPDGNVCLRKDARCDGPYACCTGMTCEQNANGESRCVAPCVQNGQECANNACCDSNARCLSFSSFENTRALCYQNCTANEQCSTGCCVNATQPGGGSCAPTNVCFPNGCQEQTESCGPSSLCCTGLVCVQSSVPSRNGCQPKCSKSADCASGCCIFFSGSTTDGFCQDASQCSCAAQGEACAGATGRSCCSGTTCAGASPTCRKNCTNDDECGSECCIPLSDGSAQVCSPC